MFDNKVDLYKQYGMKKYPKKKVFPKIPKHSSITIPQIKKIYLLQKKLNLPINIDRHMKIGTASALIDHLQKIERA